MIEIIGAICQMIMLCLLLSEVYVIRRLNRYSNTKKMQFFLMVIGLLQLIPFSFMLTQEHERFYDNGVNTINKFFIIITLVSLIFLIYVFREIFISKKNSISIDSIKEGLDDLPMGVCFYDATGTPALINNRMNQISKALNGENLNNGNEFWQSVMNYNKSDTVEYALVTLANGKVYMLKQNVYAEIKEIIATDVTDAFMLNITLGEKNERLRLHNKRLKEYNKDIERVTRDKEILETKVHIHDDMGRMLLLAKRSLAEPDNMEIRKETLRVWNANSELLAGRKKNEDEDLFANIKAVAATIGVNIIYSGNYPRNKGEITDIMINAIHECITNTVSHANGDEMYVVFTCFNNKYQMECMNNGNQPEGYIKEGGGLSSLRKRVTDFGGTMTVYGTPRFSLKIELEGN